MGGRHNQSIRESFVKQPTHLPEHHEEIEDEPPHTLLNLCVPIRSLRWFQKLEPILGKPFEDVKRHFEIGRELGRGAFAVTYLSTEKSTGMAYACKSIKRRRLNSKKDMEDMKREIQIMQHLSGQPNIVEFKGSYEDKNSIHLVMELFAVGELFDQIVTK